MQILKEFFGFGGYTREAEGYFSWQHLIFVTLLMAIMVFWSVTLGRKYHNESDKQKNKVLITSAIIIDSLELFKIIMMCIRANDPMGWTGQLPLFLCSIQFITIPLAAFSKGRIKEAALDFVTIFGILGAVMGTYFAGQLFSCYPILSIDNVISGLTHTISGFVSLYIMTSGMVSMKKQNIPVTLTVLGGFGIAAYIANIFTDANYMFLTRGDGTPYTIIENLFYENFSKTVADIIYPLTVMLLFVIYIAVFYNVYFAITEKVSKKYFKTA